jgi:single-stranded DNA-binding protein
VPDDSFENTKRNVDFFECISFGAVASMINGSFVKGCKVILTGKFKNYCFYDCNKTRHFTQVFVISRIENGDTASSFEKNVGSKSMEKTIEADLKDIYDSFDEVVKSGFVCVDEDDYYRLAFNSAPSI